MATWGTPEYGRLLDLCGVYLRAPESATTDAQNTATLTFIPPLTSAEQATFDDLQTMARFGVTMTLVEWQKIKPDAQGLIAYAGIATPTLAQTAAAVKAISRVLAVIIRT